MKRVVSDSALLKSEYRVLFFNQEVRIDVLGDQFDKQKVDTARSIGLLEQRYRQTKRC